MYLHSLTLCQYIFNIISLHMSILFSNFAVEIRTSLTLNGGKTMYKVTFKNKDRQTECFVITDYKIAMQGVVKDLLNKGYQLTIKKMEERQC